MIVGLLCDSPETLRYDPVLEKKIGSGSRQNPFSDGFPESLISYVGPPISRDDSDGGR